MMTYIGMGAILLGGFMIAHGWKSGVKGKIIGQGLILLVSGCCIGIGGNPSSDMPNGSPTMVAIGFLGLAVVIVMLVVKYQKSAATRQENAQKQAEVIGATMLDRFFVECVLAEADDFSKPKNQQRAQLLADKYNLKYPNGIAGFGAGVSTAVDLQIQNMQIRAENEKRRQAALPGYMLMTDSAQKNRKNADEIMKEIENLKLKLVSDDDAAELMKKITFSNTDVLVSETGAAMICTSASLDPNFKIFDDVPAVVDGTIIAKIYDGTRLCGIAQLVLPLYGLGQNIPLHGICLDCCKPGETYTVQFSAKNLWAMER